jgi:hypothetical protein
MVLNAAARHHRTRLGGLNNSLTKQSKLTTPSKIAVFCYDDGLNLVSACDNIKVSLPVSYSNIGVPYAR